MLNVTFFRKQTVFGWSWYCDWLSLFIIASKNKKLTCLLLAIIFWLSAIIIYFEYLYLCCPIMIYAYDVILVFIFIPLSLFWGWCNVIFVLTLSVSFYIVIRFWHYLFSFLETTSRKRVIIPDSRENKDTKNTKKIELSVLYFNELNSIWIIIIYTFTKKL